MAIARQQDDPSRKLAVDKLCALGPSRPELCGFAGVFRTLVERTLDPGCGDLLEKNVLSLGLLLNSPRLRPALEADTELAKLFAPFTLLELCKTHPKPEFIQHLDQQAP